MYNIIQLNDKNLSELQSIAQELGIKKTDSLKKKNLFTRYLMNKPSQVLPKKVAAEKLKEERKVDRQQKRTRVTVKKRVLTKSSPPTKMVTSLRQKLKPQLQLPRYNQ